MDRSMGEATNFRFNGVESCRDEWIGMRQSHRLPGSPSTMTLWRWRKIGVRSHDGSIVKLPTFVFSGRSYTTLDAYRWFVRKQRGK